MLSGVHRAALLPVCCLIAEASPLAALIRLARLSRITVSHQARSVPSYFSLDAFCLLSLSVLYMPRYDEAPIQAAHIRGLI